jgi:hypothetical protein
MTKKVIQLSTPKTDLIEVIEDCDNFLFVGSNGKEVSFAYDFGTKEDFSWLSMVLLLECMKIADDQMMEGHNDRAH